MAVNKYELTMKVREAVHELGYDDANTHHVSVIIEWHPWDFVITTLYMDTVVDRQGYSYDDKSLMRIKERLNIIHSLLTVVERRNGKVSD